MAVTEMISQCEETEIIYEFLLAGETLGFDL